MIGRPEPPASPDRGRRPRHLHTQARGEIVPRTPRQLRALVASTVAAATLATLVLAGAVPAATAATAPTAAARSIYIVQMSQLPLASYNGSIAGYPATRPAAGNKLQANSANAKKYRAYLQAQHARAVGTAKGAKKVYDYSSGFNGFAAVLTSEQAAALKKAPNVLSVTKNQLRTTDTVSTPTFLGLDAKHGHLGPGSADRRTPARTSWSPTSTPASGRRTRRSRRFARAGPLPDFHGICQTGEQWTTSDCNNKIVGARFYNAGIGGTAGVHAISPDEYLSPRDHHGHGSHTASTAAGDYNTPAVVDGNLLGNASGMAPAARLAIYKVLWGPNSQGQAVGSTADIVAAIDDAITDGVDVINFSISGSTTSDVDPVEIEFLFAADAGDLRLGGRRQRGPGRQHGQPRLAVADDRRGRNPRPVLRRQRDPRQRRDLHGRRSRRRGPVQPDRALDDVGPDRRERDQRPALLLEGVGRRPPRGLPRPGQGRRQDRRLRPRHERPRRQEQGRQGGRRRRHGPRQHLPELAERRLPLRPDRPREQHRRRRDQGLRQRHRQPDRLAGRRPQGHRRRGPARRELLVAWSGARRRRRPAQAGHHGSGRRRPRRQSPRTRNGRNFDFESGTSMATPAHRRHRRAASSSSTRLVADGDQVGADDDRIAEGQHRRPDHDGHRRPGRRLRLWLRPGHAEQGA